jgi:diguanylate cyclase (GGDEF)-like protein
MDLDRFKTVNDTLGHDSGNQLLRQVTQRLLSCLRDGDTLARIGGDEFALVLPDMTQADDAARIARDIAQAFNACIVVDGSQVFVSLSIGIALYPLDDRDGATLLRDADSAMYHAKTLGRGNFQFYSAELTQRARQRMTLETGLRQALEREEFKLHYQAQVDIKTGQVLGVEALLRWDQPGTGAVSPASFIGVAEDCGLIVSLGEWVLRTACAQAKAWHAQGFTSLTMAVNLSARQFAPGKLVELVELIKSVLEETGLPAHCLELEITESILIDNADATVLAALREFKRMGITLALDDFGTGYCSLSYLKRFPIDKLKIDKSFIQGITSDPDDAALVRAIIAMARSLRLCVIAEGVETQEQYEHLRQQDCDQMQGNYFSHPASAQTVNELFKVLEYFPVPLARDKPHR